MAKAKSDDKAAAKRRTPRTLQGAVLGTEPPRQTCLSGSRAQEGATDPHHPTVGDLPGTCDRAAGLSGLSLRR